MLAARRWLRSSSVEGRGPFAKHSCGPTVGRCAITGCSIGEILEAAHIYPYRGDATNHVTNGLLLRSDLHTLFDCGLIAIDEAEFKVLIGKELRGSEYERYRGKLLRLPDNPSFRPSGDALRQHRQQSGLDAERSKEREAG